jgi:hypothetical protein
MAKKINSTDEALESAGENVEGRENNTGQTEGDAPASVISVDASENMELNELGTKLKQAFENFPTVDTVYHNGQDVFFYFAKPNMTKIEREKFFNEIKRK